MANSARSDSHSSSLPPSSPPPRFLSYIVHEENASATSTFAAVMFASLLAGFLAIHLSNRLLNLYLCHDDERADYAVGIIPMIGVGLHSFIDGVIYSVAFNVSVFTGVLAAIGMVLHEFPEGIVTFVLLERGGFSRRRSALYAFLAAAISTPLGALVSYPFINSVAVIIVMSKA